MTTVDAVDASCGRRRGRGTRRPARPGSARLEQQTRVGQDRIARPVRRRWRASAAPEPDEVERFLVRLVRDPEAAAGVDEAELDARRARPAAARRRTVVATCSTSADASRTFDAPKACSPSRSRCGECAARSAAAPRGPRRPSRTCRRRRRRRAGRARAGRLADGRPQQHRLDAGPRRGRDRLQPGQLAGRLDRDRPDPGRHGRAQLVVALARAGHDDPVRVDAGPADRARARRPTRRRRRARAEPRWATTASAGFALTA